MKLFVHRLGEITFCIKVGQNQRENWAIIDDAEAHDMWFHLDGDIPSAHVVISYSGRPPTTSDEYPKEIIQMGSSLCRQFSKHAKNSKKTVDVCYTTVGNIKKGRDIGSVIILNKHDACLC